jgi:hypothetical protein
MNSHTERGITVIRYNTVLSKMSVYIHLYLYNDLFYSFGLGL